MTVCCLSYYLSDDLSCYNGEYNIHVEQYKNNEKKINICLHSGTHIDMPLHVDNNGKSLSDYGIEKFIFNKPYIKEVSASDNYFSVDDIADVPEDIDFLIIKLNKFQSRNDGNYALCNTGISEDVAKYIRKKFKNICGIGINSISVNAYCDKESGRKAHKEFLANKPEIFIVEDMKLDEVKEGALKKLIVAPLLVKNADGVPVTVIAEVC